MFFFLSLFIIYYLFIIFHSSVSISSKGAPTNIYIQGLESVNQLASEIRLLKEENVSLQNQLKQVTKGTV